MLSYFSEEFILCPLGGAGFLPTTVVYQVGGLSIYPRVARQRPNSPVGELSQNGGLGFRDFR